MKMTNHTGIFEEEVNVSIVLRNATLSFALKQTDVKELFRIVLVFSTIA